LGETEDKAMKVMNREVAERYCERDEGRNRLVRDDIDKHDNAIGTTVTLVRDGDVIEAVE
jgi:ribosomal protein L17